MNKLDRNIDSAGTAELMAQMGIAARAAAREVALAPPAQKNEALAAAAKAIRDSVAIILEANAKDVEASAGKWHDRRLHRPADAE